MPSIFSEISLRPSFFLIVPDNKPRTEWVCHPVAVLRSSIVVPLGRFSISTTVASLLDFVDMALEGLANWGAPRILAEGLVAEAVGFKRTLCCDAVFFVDFQGLVLLLCVFIICLLGASSVTAYAVTVRSPGRLEALRGGSASGGHWRLTLTATLS